MRTWPAALPLHTLSDDRCCGVTPPFPPKLHSSRIALCFVASTLYSLAIVNAPPPPPPQPPLGKKNMYTHILIPIRYCTNARFERNFCVFANPVNKQHGELYRTLFQTTKI